jgi:hypothetical protein
MMIGGRCLEPWLDGYNTPMSVIDSFTLRVDDERTIFGALHAPDRPGPRPVVVLCHGFKGFMDWGFFPPLAELLTDRGFAVVRFNFTGSGMQPGDVLVTDPESFRRATFTQDVRELTRVLEALGTEIGEGRVAGKGDLATTRVRHGNQLSNRPGVGPRRSGTRGSGEKPAPSRAAGRRLVPPGTLVDPTWRQGPDRACRGGSTPRRPGSRSL